MHLSRRQLLQSAGASALALTLPTFAAAEEKKKKTAFTLPKLPYDYDALEPHIDAETMKIHHDKHHQAYVDNLNKALAEQPALQGNVDLSEILDDACRRRSASPPSSTTAAATPTTPSSGRSWAPRAAASRGALAKAHRRGVRQLRQVPEGANAGRRHALRQRLGLAGA